MANSTTPCSGGSAPTGPGEFRGSARYEVLGCLGRGGMGVVYEVFDRQQQERVALKTLLHFDAASLYRFKQEFRTLADVLHPNLVHLHELVASDRDEVLFTMELVEGEDFLGYVHKPGTPRVAEKSKIVPIDSGVRLARQAGGGPGFEIDGEPMAVCPADIDRLRPALRQLVDGVRALHAAGKLHRDIKPSNVRITAEGRVVLLDFGVATELGRGTRAENGVEEVVGTVAYMAPEQASGDAPVAASDWYSVGALLYEALVGRPPFSGSPLEVLTMKYTVAPTPPAMAVAGVPEDLNALCLELLAPDPEGRPTATDILRRLGVTMASDQAPAPHAAEGQELANLVGREPQLRELRSAFDATGDGRAISVRVAGLSGLGKSAVVHHFLDEIEGRTDVVVLRGRAYERESVPYKAVDSVVDALTRHLIELQDTAQAIELPEEIWALAHVFPVLRRVRAIDETPAAPVGDPQVIRGRAFGVLRELFATLCKRRRVVVFIDDVQWGDTDSAALLVELMRPPTPPPLMLVTTHRAEEERSSPFLADLRARWPEDAEVRELSVGPLEFDEARRMALALMGSDDAMAQQTAEGIARESGGSPFLLEELARSASGYHRLILGDALARRGAVTLEQVLGDRAARLPDDARRLLEVVAVSGRPLPVATVGAAARVGDQANQLVALLRARRFVRAGLREGREVVESSHDRIRETIVAGLSAETAREHHAQLARVLEATPEADPEAIASHLLGAGDRERAAHYAERAADQAVAKLAFAQAARLYQLTLDTVGKSSPEAPRLARRTAEASEWAGLPEKAARAYLVAAEGAPTALERMDLERAAAAQLTAAGLIDEGAALSNRVLAAVGRTVPRSVLAVVAAVIFYRVLSVVLARRKLAEPRELEPEERLRLEALHAAQRALAVIDPFSALYVKARYLVDALRSGSRAHIVRAAAAEASTLAGAGGIPGKRETALFAMALTLSKQTGDQEGYGLYLITYGVSQYLRGRWRAAIDILDPTVAQLAALRRWNANANVYAVYALGNMGDMREVKARTLRLLVDSEQRGDLFTSVNLRASHPMGAWLASDDVDGARRHLRESMEQWSKKGFLVQHWQSMLWEAEVDLYAGEGARAWDRLGRDARALKRGYMTVFIQLIRVFTLFVRGRAAIASLESLSPEARGPRLEEARKAQRALAKQRLPWIDPLAEIVKACIAGASGDRAGAEAALRRTITLAEAAEMSLHAAAARHQAGILVGGEAGHAMVIEAEEAMKSRGVRHPARYAEMLVPGKWAPKEQEK